MGARLCCVLRAAVRVGARVDVVAGLGDTLHASQRAWLPNVGILQMKKQMSVFIFFDAA